MNYIFNLLSILSSVKKIEHVFLAFTTKSIHSMLNYSTMKPIRIISILLIALLTMANGCRQGAENNSTASRKENGNHEQQPHQQDGDHKYTNALINERSPYLKIHAHNPVNWYPWGDEALNKAQQENKLIIVSVGYTACHWCHVMERESFQDTTVAKVMNKNYVSIKVDREQRPDVDDIYMNAAHMISGSGGWPLNAIALPDGRPVFAGTYFPRKKWLKVLRHFRDAWRQNPQKLRKQAKKVTRGIKQAGQTPVVQTKEEFTVDNLRKGWKQMKGNIDFKNGGDKGSPVFPMPNRYQFLLRYHYFTQDDKALEAVRATLDNMAKGGIYDHLGGGFARYSTDKQWKVPHFEKMLYDNGQLVSLYAKAYQQTGDEYYKEVVYETLEFIDREMTSPEGGFYSSLSAISDGKEGKFYIWSKQEISEVLSDDMTALFSDYYNVTDNGNWKRGKNVLWRTKPKKEIAQKHGMSMRKMETRMDEARQKLFEKRVERERPQRDDKILTEWNALMLKGYVDAYRVFGEERFLKAAKKNANFLVNNAMHENSRLTRNYKDGKATINGFLDDYSFTIEAFVALYQATFEEKWLNHAKSLADYTIAHFYDANTGMFFYKSDEDRKLIARNKEVRDNVIPASNSSLAKGLFYLGKYFYNDDYVNRSRQMLKNVKQQAMNKPDYHGNWLTLMTWFVEDPYEIAIVGEDARAKRASLDRHYIPNALYLGGKNEGSLELLKNKFVEGKTTIYVCRNKVCKRPVTEPEKALGLIGE